MLFRCCLIQITIIVLRQIFYLVYLHPCLGLDLFMSCLGILFFTFSLIFVVINHVTSSKQMYLFSCPFLENLVLFLSDNVDEEDELFSNSQNSTSACCLAFAWFFDSFSLALLIKVLLIKKRAFILEIGKC